MWSFYFPCLSCLDVWLEEIEADCRKPISSTTFVNQVIGKDETSHDAPRRGVTYLDQLVVPSRNDDLYQASAVRGKLNTRSSSRTPGILVAAMARSDE